MNIQAHVTEEKRGRGTQTRYFFGVIDIMIDIRLKKNLKPYRAFDKGFRFLRYLIGGD